MNIKKIAIMATMVLGFGMSMTPTTTIAAKTTTNTQTHFADLNQLFNQVAKQSLVRAKFTQQKKLANSNKVFYSSGQIVFAKHTGVLWLIQRPIKADLIMTKKTIVQKTANTQSKINLAQNQYAGVASIFLQLLTGDQQALLKNFQVEQLSYKADGWSLTLSPKTSTLKKLFGQVQLSGDEVVKQIIIDEKQGGQTTIQLSSHSTGTALTAEEMALFGLAK